MPYALFYALLAGFFAFHSASLGAFGLALLWPALTFMAVAIGYAGAGPAMLGKRPDGTQSPAAFALFLPYFAFTDLTWRALCLLGPSRPFDLVADRVYLGRRPRAPEVPSECAMVVDLTSEFRVLPGVLDGRAYRCVPTLDGMPPDLDAVAALVEELHGFPGVIYVHCAAGHSRSACVVAALLIRRGAARDVAGAMAIIRQTRRYAWLGRAQRAMVQRYSERVALV